MRNKTLFWLVIAVVLFVTWVIVLGPQALLVLSRVF